MKQVKEVLSLLFLTSLRSELKSPFFAICLFQSAAAAPSPVLGNLPPGEGMPVGPVPPGFFQVCMQRRAERPCFCHSRGCNISSNLSFPIFGRFSLTSFQLHCIETAPKSQQQAISRHFKLKERIANILTRNPMNPLRARTHSQITTTVCIFTYVTFEYVYNLKHN